MEIIDAHIIIRPAAKFSVLKKPDRVREKMPRRVLANPSRKRPMAIMKINSRIDNV